MSPLGASLDDQGTAQVATATAHCTAAEVPSSAGKSYKEKLTLCKEKLLVAALAGNPNKPQHHDASP